VNADTQQEESLIKRIINQKDPAQFHLLQESAGNRKFFFPFAKDRHASKKTKKYLKLCPAALPSPWKHGLQPSMRE
jgi:hypothetical protein